MDDAAGGAPRSNGNERRFAAGIADALLLFFPSLGLAQKLVLPQAWSDGAFMSGTVRAGVDPLTNYVQLGLCAIVVWGAFWSGFRRGQPIVAWIADRVKRRSSFSGAQRIGAWTFGTIACAVYLVNVTAVTIDGPLVDGFHEGQYLGYIPALAAGKAILDSVMIIHGPGVDLLPGVLAVKLASPEHGIVATRFAYAALRTAAVVASLLALLAFTRLLLPERRRGEWLAASALGFMVLTMALPVGGWEAMPVYHKVPNARDTVFLLQIVLVLAFALAQQHRRPPTAALALAAAAGALAPWALAYSYDRGLYGAAFLALASFAFAAAGGTWTRHWFAGVVAGAAIGCAALYATFGREAIGAGLEQIAFWFRYGRAMWAYPGFAVPPDSLAGALTAGCLVALAIAGTIVLRAIAAEASVGAGIRREIGVTLMLAASIVPLRPAIERGDVGHVAWAVTGSWIMLSALTARFALRALQAMPRNNGRPANTAPPGAPAALIAIATSFVVGSNLTFFDPSAAWARVRSDYYGKLATDDAAILSPGQRQAKAMLRHALGASPCFYTLTNESTWYYLVGKPSCSRFDQVTNARPIAAQREVIAELEAGSPPFVLFASRQFGNMLDGVSTFDASPEVMRYVLRRYAPDAWVGDEWIWRRSEAPPRFSDRGIGAITDAPTTGTRMLDLVVTGTYGDAAASAPARAIFVTNGDDNAPVWAGPSEPREPHDHWSAVVPTAGLAAGKHRLRFWALQDERGPLTQLGTGIEVELR